MEGRWEGGRREYGREGMREGRWEGGREGVGRWEGGRDVAREGDREGEREVDLLPTI